jgi:TonB family protein
MLVPLLIAFLLASATIGLGQEGDTGAGFAGCMDCGGDQPVVDYDKPPRRIKMTSPQYPKEAYAEKIEGTVVVEILIDAKGRVHPRRILTSIPALDAAAVETVKQWLFSPATKKGRPVATIAHAPITFRVFERPTDHCEKPPALNALLDSQFLPLPEAFHPRRLTVQVSFFYNGGPPQHQAEPVP